MSIFVQFIVEYKTHFDIRKSLKQDHLLFTSVIYINMDLTTL